MGLGDRFKARRGSGEQCTVDHPSCSSGLLPRRYAPTVKPGADFHGPSCQPLRGSSWLKFRANTGLTRLRVYGLGILTFPSQNGPISSLQVTAFTFLTPVCFLTGTYPPPDCLLTPYKLAASIQERLLCQGQSTPPTQAIQQEFQMSG